MPRSAVRRRPETAPSAARQTRRERRRYLLAQAVLVFAERGYHGTTPEMVAEAAGISEASLARTFTDREDLFRGALEEVRATTIDLWRTEAESLPEPLARLNTVVERYLVAARSGAPAIRLLLRSLAECDGTEIADPLREFFQDAETFLASLLVEGQQAGVMRRSLDPRAGAWQVLHAGLGLAASSQLATEASADPEALANAVDCLLHGLLKTDV